MPTGVSFRRSPTALVTGASSGIGAAIAAEAARAAHDLVLVGRDEARLSAVADQLSRDYGGRCEVLLADLADPTELAFVEARLTDPGRPVDVLVNNAGYALGRGFLGTTADEQQQMLDVLCGAVLRLTRTAVGPMAARGHGAVLNVSSVAGFVPYGTYGAAKAWVTSFTEGLAVEFTGTGVRAVVVCPGFTRTRFHERAGVRADGPSLAWLDAADVARTAWRALSGRRTVVVPTVRYRLAAEAARLAPRPLVAALARRFAFRAAPGRAPARVASPGPADASAAPAVLAEPAGVRR